MTLKCTSCMHKHTHTYTYSHSHTHTRTHPHTYTYSHSYTHTYTHTHTHIHTHSHPPTHIHTGLHFISAVCIGSPGSGVFSGSLEVNHLCQSLGYWSNELAMPMKLASLEERKIRRGRKEGGRAKERDGRGSRGGTRRGEGRG